MGTALSDWGQSDSQHIFLALAKTVEGDIMAVVNSRGGDVGRILATGGL